MGALRSAAWTFLCSLLMITEVAAAAHLDLESEWQAQWNDLAAQLKTRRPWFERVQDQAGRREALVLAGDRDPLDVVLRRTEALLCHVSALGPGRDLDGEAKSLEGFRRKAAAEAVNDAATPEGPRYRLYLDVCALRRRIAFANPLLDFNEILFVKRHLSANHMCDQFYGHTAKPGGGLFVLVDAFGNQPAARDLLAGTVVEEGRLAGSKLEPGAFLSPELSFDAQTILFAYTERKGKPWTPGSVWHIFRVRADGTALAQVTEGAWNDFDPCLLPDGRVAFISERRGGYLRCSPGRPCPVYTLFSMRSDGSDVRPLSYHETHEWQPSVDHDGMLLYTRWDYVDRDTNAAHHLWTSFPDGRDPRALHGNYPVRRNARPWFEADVRAIPGQTGRYVATAAAHHGQAFGSLVLIDLALPDDGAMGQVRRLTPEVPFPEGERGKPVFATPWPLSDRYVLAAYDPAGRNHGLYLVDAFGNRELLYRDRSIPSMSPIPLRPRRKPPAIPSPLASPTEDGAPGTVAVLNVYDADFEWPEGTHIEALRIVQLLSKTTPVLNRPRIGVAGQTNARRVLGTVPVEADGSAFFVAPAGKPLYFQALDGRGLAVQSMRSVTYVHPGERLTCAGCHERKRAARTLAAPPLALKRAPSRMAPEPRGSNPFNYAALVQPALDRHCVACHEKKGAIDLTGAPGSKGFTRSYEALARRYGFHFDSTKGCYGRGRNTRRTVPGAFGARAAPLMAYLGEEHYGVKLPPEDRRRFVVWLDANSEFFGAYHDTEAQLKGELVEPELE